MPQEGFRCHHHERAGHRFQLCGLTPQQVEILRRRRAVGNTHIVTGAKL